MNFLSRDNGPKNYNRCDNKQISEISFGTNNLLVGLTLACPKLREEGKSLTVRADALSHRNNLSLWLGTSSTPDSDMRGESRYYQTPGGAGAHLGAVASMAICKGCDFAQLSPAEATSTLADKLEDRVQIARDELRIAEATAALRQAHAEIESLDL